MGLSRSIHLSEVSTAARCPAACAAPLISIVVMRCSCRATDPLSRSRRALMPVTPASNRPSDSDTCRSYLSKVVPFVTAPRATVVSGRRPREQVVAARTGRSRRPVRPYRGSRAQIPKPAAPPSAAYFAMARSHGGNNSGENRTNPRNADRAIPAHVVNWSCLSRPTLVPRFAQLRKDQTEHLQDGRVIRRRAGRERRGRRDVGRGREHRLG